MRWFWVAIIVMVLVGGVVSSREDSKERKKNFRIFSLVSFGIVVLIVILCICCVLLVCFLFFCGIFTLISGILSLSFCGCCGISISALSGSLILRKALFSKKTDDIIMTQQQPIELSDEPPENPTPIRVKSYQYEDQ